MLTNPKLSKTNNVRACRRASRRCIFAASSSSRLPSSWAAAAAASARRCSAATRFCFTSRVALRTDACLGSCRSLCDAGELRSSRDKTCFGRCHHFMRCCAHHVHSKRCNVHLVMVQLKAGAAHARMSRTLLPNTCGHEAHCAWPAAVRSAARPSDAASSVFFRRSMSSSAAASAACCARYSLRSRATPRSSAAIRATTCSGFPFFSVNARVGLCLVPACLLYAVCAALRIFTCMCRNLNAR